MSPNQKAYRDLRQALVDYEKFLDDYFPKDETKEGKPFDNVSLKELQRLTQEMVSKRLTWEGSL